MYNTIVEMRMKIVLILALSLLLSVEFAQNSSQEAMITESPQATNISANGVAEFDCSASASSGTSIIIVWEVDGSQKLETNSHYHGNIIKSILRLPASSVNNTATTNIECILYTNVNNTPKKIDYKTVPLMIQGPLESVDELTVVSINSTTVLISWSPPFTLEGVPILGCNVTITNTTSGEKLETAITTMLNYTFSIDHPDPDNNFTVTVVPINGAGPGEPATEFFFVDLKSCAPTCTQDFTSTLFTSSITAVSSIGSVVPTDPTPGGLPPKESVVPTDPTPNGHGVFIGYIVGGIIVVLLLVFVLVLVLFVVVVYTCVKKYHRRGNSDHDSSCELGLTVRNGISKGPSLSQTESNGAAAASDLMDKDKDASTTDSSCRGDSGIATDNSNEYSVQTTNTAPGLDISSNDTPIEESSSENPELVAGKVQTLPELQPIDQTSQPTGTLQPVTASFKYQVADDDQFPPGVTVKAVTVSETQTDYSMILLANSKPVIVRENVNPFGKLGINYLFVLKAIQPQVYLLSDKDLSDYTASQSHDAADDNLTEAVLPLLKRRNSQLIIVSGLSETTQPCSKYPSHPVDPESEYELIHRCKKNILQSAEESSLGAKTVVDDDAPQPLQHPVPSHGKESLRH